jgi:sec-independent protein translocase protein TatB
VGISEIIVIAIIALIVLGPEKLPEVMVAVGRVMRELRAASNSVMREIHADFEEPPPVLMRRERPPAPTSITATSTSTSVAPPDPDPGEPRPPVPRA